MRIEKGFRHWKSDLITEFNPIESGLSRFVKMDKDFVGKAPLQTMLAAGNRRQFVALELASTDMAAHAGDSVLLAGKVVGTVCSAAWGYRVNKNLALAFVAPQAAGLHQALTVEVLGTAVPAVIVDECQYDPSFARLRC